MAKDLESVGASECRSVGGSQPSTFNPQPTLSQLLLEQFRDVGFALVQDDAEVALGFGEEISGAFDDVAVGFLGFDDEEHHIHELRQSGSGADLADRRHVKNDVVVVARLQFWDQIRKAPGQDARQLIARAAIAVDLAISVAIGFQGFTILRVSRMGGRVTGTVIVWSERRAAFVAVAI